MLIRICKSGGFWLLNYYLYKVSLYSQSDCNTTIHSQSLGCKPKFIFMRIKYPTCILLVTLFLTCSETKSRLITYTNVHLIDVKTGHIKKTNISTIDNNIAFIGDTYEKESRQIDLNGKYIIPPIWDMHVHTQGEKKSLEQFFLYGVLGVRDMGTFSDSSTIQLKKQAERQNSQYPDIRYAGRLHSDTTCSENHVNIKNVEDVIKSIEYNKTQKAEFYKVHNCYPQDLMPIVDSMAQKANLKIVGHIPEGFDPIDYARKFSISSIEYISIPLRALSYREENPLTLQQAVELLDGNYLDSFAQVLKKDKIAFTPNLRSEYLFIQQYPENQKHLGEALYGRYKNYTKRLLDSGVLLLAGSDFGLEGLEPGLSIHEELVLLSEAGMSSLQVLQIATLNPIIYLRQEENISPISVGETANFLILNENPLEDIKFTRSIYGIVNSGILQLNK